MISAFTQFAATENASGIGALGFDPKAFLVQLITFVLAFLILRRFAFGPIAKMLDERRETIERGVKLGEDMRKEKAALEQQIEEQLHDARQKADSMIAGAEDTGRQTVRDAEDKARDKAANIVAEAEGRIVTETARARQALESELTTLVAEATEAVIEEKVDAKKDAQLIEKALKRQSA